jgi:hypothetical protein
MAISDGVREGKINRGERRRENYSKEKEKETGEKKKGKDK